jgi:hypothetical protein
VSDPASMFVSDLAKFRYAAAPSPNL